jgi:hypothetical protein
VLDANNHRVRLISPAGVVTTLAGTGANASVDGPAVSAQFSYPSGLSLDAGGNIFVGEFGSQRIRKIETLATQTVFGTVPAAPIAGEPYTLKASIVRPSGTGTPTGSVLFTDTSTLNTAVLVDGLGNAELPGQVRGAGTYNYTAAFTGTNLYAGSSAALAVVVAQAPASVTLAAPASAAVGSAVTLSATVSSPYLAPTGTVTLKDGATVLGTATLAGASATSASASIAWTPTGLGAHSITALYNGDADVLTGASTVSTLTVAPVAAVSIADATVTEGNSGTTAMTFNVTLAGAATVPVSVSVSTANGTASAPSDFAAIVASTVTFAPGVVTMPVTVNVVGDTAVEANEIFTLTISATSPTGVTIARATATGTIANDDSTGATTTTKPPRAKVRITQVCTGTNNAPYTSFTWTLTNRGTSPVTFVWRTHNGSPLQTGTVMLAPGATSATFTVIRRLGGNVLDVLVGSRVIAHAEPANNRAQCVHNHERGDDDGDDDDHD